MWLAVRYAAKAELPDLAHAIRELGSPSEASLYRRLFESYPRVKRGPDEDMSSHFSRLKSAHETSLAKNPETKRRAEDPSAKVRVGEPISAPWRDLAPVIEGQPDSITDLKGMPQRIPGWFTGDAMDAPPPGYGVPPMSRRDPGATTRAPVSPVYEPDQQSMQDWVKWLRDKGIEVDHTLQRPDAAQRQKPYRPLTGPEIWPQFVGPSTDASIDKALRDLPESAGGLGRSWKQRAKDLFSTRKASAVVTEYIEGVLVATATVRGGMEDEGWTHHESGSGNWYEKKIGDQLHRIVAQPDGWIHAHGPANGEKDEYGDPAMTGNPMMFDNLRDAMLHAHTGHIQVGFTAKPPTSLRSMNSWSGV